MTAQAAAPSLRVGLVASIGVTLDAFFPEIAAAWSRDRVVVFPAAGSTASLEGTEVLRPLTRRPSIENLSAPRAIRRWAAAHDLDLVITNTATASALVRMSGLDCPVIYFCHGLHWSDEDPSIGTWPWRLVERRLAARTAGVIVLNSADERWFRRSGIALPILRLPFGIGVDTTTFVRVPLPERRGSSSVVWVGEFSRRKDPHAALRVVRLAQRCGANLDLHMLGDGPLMPSIRKCLASDASLRARVHLHGRVDVAPFLAGADAVLHTARWEGLARALLEATAVGRPIVGWAVKGVRDLPDAVVVPRGDEGALANQLCAVLEDPAAYAPLTRVEQLSYTTSAATVLAFARNVLSAAGGVDRVRS
jgi:glycosyltransferase involved in cell wall biosynthesis